MKLPLQIMKVKERSMEPLIRNGSYVIVNNFAKSYSVGDIVIARHPKKGIMLIKRIERIDDDTFSLIGNNKDESEDSRSFGFVSRDLIIGKVVSRIE